MPIITSTGIGSNLDVESIITGLMSVERRPVDLLTEATTSIKTKLSSIGQLQSLVSTMRDKANSLASVSLWGQTKLSSNNSAVVSGSSTLNAPEGRYSVTVRALASAQTITSGQFAKATDTLSEGSLSIELGTWAGSGTLPATGFTAKANTSPVSITIGPDDTSLEGIRDKINAAEAGVTATIVNDANGARLSIRSTETGAENGFRITATETTDDGSAATGLSALGFNAATTTSPMAMNQWSANAKADINGIAVESTSNTFSEVADGMTLTVGQVSTTPVEVVVANDTSAVKTAIDDFVKAYNAMAQYIKDQTKYDEANKTAGALQADRTVVGFQTQARNIFNQPSTASSEWSVLSEIGLSLNKDGLITTSSSKLNDALLKPDELRKLLATDGSTSGESGFMDRFRDLGNQVLGVDGSLELREAAIQAQIKRNDDRQAEMEVRLARTEARLRAQYEALDTSMASLNALSSYVTAQFSSSSS